MTEPPPARPPDRRGAGHQRRRRGHARAHVVPAIAAAGAAVGVCGAPRRRTLRVHRRRCRLPAGRASPPAGAGRRRPGGAAAAPGPPAPTSCTPTGCAPGWSPRPPGGWPGAASARLVLTLHNALQESAGRKQRVLRAVEGTTIRGADLVLAVSGDLADNARRLGARDVRVAPAARAAAAPGPPSRGRGPRGARAGRRAAAGRRRRPAAPAEGLRRPARRRRAMGARPGLPAPLVAIAGDGPLEEELAERIRAERLPVRLLGRRDRRRRPARRAADLCVLPPAGRAPLHRPGGAARGHPAGLDPHRRIARAARRRRRARARRRRRGPRRRRRRVLWPIPAARALAEAGGRRRDWPDEAARPAGSSPSTASCWGPSRMERSSRWRRAGGRRPRLDHGDGPGCRRGRQWLRRRGRPGRDGRGSGLVWADVDTSADCGRWPKLGDAPRGVGACPPGRRRVPVDGWATLGAGNPRG